MPSGEGCLFAVPAASINAHCFLFEVGGGFSYQAACGFNDQAGQRRIIRTGSTPKGALGLQVHGANTWDIGLQVGAILGTIGAYGPSEGAEAPLGRLLWNIRACNFRIIKVSTVPLY